MDYEQMRMSGMRMDVEEKLQDASDLISRTFDLLYGYADLLDSNNIRSGGLHDRLDALEKEFIMSGLKGYK